MKRILYDQQCFSNQDFGGISQYFVDLWEGLRQSQEYTKVILPRAMTSNANWPAWKNRWGPSIRRGFVGKPRLYSAFNRHFALNLIRSGRFDIFHPTYYDHYFLNALAGKKYILTVYDMIQEEFEGIYFARNSALKNAKLNLCHGASRIHAISSSTKSRLSGVFGIDPLKIDIVYPSYEPVEAGLSGTVIAKLPDNYVLYVGGRKAYKNFKKLLQGFREVGKRHLDLFLVCAGGTPFSAGERLTIVDQGLSRKVVWTPMNREVKALLYRRAQCFVFPSFAEGFGIPLLEAMQNECAIVCSDIDVFKEVCQDSAFYFNPGESDSIEAALLECLGSSEILNQHTKDGKKRLMDFRLAKMAESAIKSYKLAIEG